MSNVWSITMEENNELKSGSEHDRMDFEPLEWKGITFWCLCDSAYYKKTKIKRFCKIEAYSMRKGQTYRLMRSNTSSKSSHPSGWNLDIIDFDISKKNRTIHVSKHSLLKKATFSELFVVLSVLMDEEDNPNILIEDRNNFSVLGFVSNNEVARIKRKIKKWLSDLPEWLNSTIEVVQAQNKQ